MADLRERRRVQVHDEVRAAAIALMSLRGFDGVTVEEIAASTSVSPSTIYRHFSTKEALVLSPGRPAAVVERVARDTKRGDTPALRRAVNRVYGRDDDVPGELRLVLGNVGLLDQFRREWTDAAGSLAEAFATRDGRADARLGDHARAAAHIASVTVAIEAWADPDGPPKLGAALDTALAAVA